MNVENWLKVLRANGYRVTEVQEAIISILVHTERPFSAKEVWDVARQSHPDIGRATVFRTVEKLESLSLLRRIHGYNGCSHYLPITSDSVLLFICTMCGRAEYLDRSPLDMLITAIEQQSHHHIDNSHLQLFGICIECTQVKGSL